MIPPPDAIALRGRNLTYEARKDSCFKVSPPEATAWTLCKPKGQWLRGELTHTMQPFIPFVTRSRTRESKKHVSCIHGLSWGYGLRLWWSRSLSMFGRTWDLLVSPRLWNVEAEGLLGRGSCHLSSVFSEVRVSMLWRTEQAAWHSPVACVRTQAFLHLCTHSCALTTYV